MSAADGKLVGAQNLASGPVLVWKVAPLQSFSETFQLYRRVRDYFITRSVILSSREYAGKLVRLLPRISKTRPAPRRHL